jgi:hypothetical protein
MSGIWKPETVVQFNKSKITSADHFMPKQGKSSKE